MRIRLLGRLLLGAISTGLLLMAVTFAQTPSQQRTLVVRIDTDIFDLDPASIRATIDYAVALEIYSGLVKLEPGSFDTVVPDLATEWSVSEDGLAYTFKLRDDVTWHSGFGRLVAGDVAYSLERHKDPEVGSLYRTDAAAIDRVEVHNDYELTVHLVEPWPEFLVEFLAYRPGLIINRDAIEQGGDEYTSRPIGTGPFVLERWTPGDRIRLVANPDYFGNVPMIAAAELVIIPSDALFELALETGEVHMGFVTAPEVQERLLANPNIELVTTPSPQTIYVYINTGVEPWSDPRVRQALAYATDKATIVEGVFKGLATASDTIVSPALFGHLPGQHFDYNPERARELLAEAGYPNGISSDLLLLSIPEYPRISTILQAMWSAAGINVTLTQMEPAQIIEQSRAGNFRLGITGITRVGPNQVLNYLLHSSSIGTGNYSVYSNPEFDRLVDQARATLDEQERASLYHDAQRILYEDIPILPLYQPDYVLAVSSGVLGAQIVGVRTYNLSSVRFAD